MYQIQTKISIIFSENKENFILQENSSLQWTFSKYSWSSKSKESRRQIEWNFAILNCRFIHDSIPIQSDLLIKFNSSLLLDNGYVESLKNNN